MSYGFFLAQTAPFNFYIETYVRICYHILTLERMFLLLFFVKGI